MPLYATSTDAVLLITKELRKQLPAKEESLDMFVEFFGPAVDELSIADRSGESLLPISEFVLDEKFQRKASKFAIFYILYENPKLLFPFFISCYFMFFPL